GQSGANGMIMPQVAIYRGDCTVDGLAELLCASAEVNENQIVLNAIGLTPGVVYFLRINDYSTSATPNWGNFRLCIDKVQPASMINQGMSVLCQGELYDTGGPNGDYSANENNTFSICPTDLHSCIIFTMDYFNVEAAPQFGVSGDVITFYNGPNVNSPVITTINGDGFNDPVGGGSVCFMVRAETAGCLTIQMQTDGTSQFEGFKAHWTCSNDCPVVTIPTIDTLANNEMILASLTSPQNIVTIDTINCPRSSYGTFLATDNSAIGLSKGIILTSGSAAFPAAPNMETGGAIFPDNDNLAPGDADLDSLSIPFGGNESHNACILELDVFANTDEIRFEYVFGSEEYPEYSDDVTNFSFNDIFAFLISGPGIVGNPLINNQLNIAVLPNTNIPVEINSVNNIENWPYYRNNQNSQNLAYDGLTADSLGIKKSLTARASVQPCNTYHLKLAVADRGDSAFDSGVFISDIQGGTPNLEVSFASGINYFIENCSGTNDELVIKLNNALTQAITFDIIIGGTATLGTDYLLEIPSQISFAAGETQISFPLVPINDDLVEGTETIIIQLRKDYGCGNVLLDEIVLDITDRPVVEIVPLQDTLFLCQNGSVQISVHGATTYFWTPVNNVDDPQSSMPTVSPTQEGWLKVVGQVGTCTASDSIYMKIINPQINIVTTNPTNICSGTSVQLQADNNVLDQGLVWTPALYLNNATIPNPIATPTQSITYTATINIGGCIVTDNIEINVDDFYSPELINDSIVCQNYPVQLAYSNNDNTGSVYSWTPTAGLNNPNSAEPIATPETTTTYQLISQSENNYCRDTQTITLTVLPADVNILQNDTTNLCLGESLTIQTNSSTNGLNLIWTPNNGTLSSTTGANVSATPTESTLYIVQLTAAQCVVYDSIYVHVDSIPFRNQQINKFLDKEYYCIGDTIILRTPPYDPIDFPDIQHSWSPTIGAQSPIDEYNLVLTASSTQVYQRITTNNVCVDTALILINVVEPIINVSPTDTTVCPNQPVQANIFNSNVSNIRWMPSNGLSCSDCTNPLITVENSTLFQVSGELHGCPATAQVVVNVTDNIPVGIDVSPATEVNIGEVVTLTANTNITNPSYQWSNNGANIGNTQQVSSAISEIQHIFVVTVTNGVGCTNTATVVITGIPPSYDIPNAFSPDGDGTNDKFRMIIHTPATVAVSSFQVFNRWGEKVYDATNTDGWDGTFKGKTLPSDVYAYMIKLRLPFDKEVLLKGDVTLLR
ncbi:MAG: choice-of-anchor L domain-containing protein, partial [Saprospiraceae bacterium]